MITITTFLFVVIILAAVVIGGFVSYAFDSSVWKNSLRYSDVTAAVDDAIRAHEELFNHHDEDTLLIVLQSLREHGVSVKTATNMINTMQNNGILFRQHRPDNGW